MKKTFPLLCSITTFICLCISLQFATASAGPVLYLNGSQHQSEAIDAAIGTRYFVQISSSPTFQLARGFLESCTVTNVGAPFTIPFPGGLVYRNGTIYTWNQSAPYQLWSIDTVTGVHTYLFNITGVPQANLTGMTWDGTTMYGVSTSASISQLFTINMSTGVCTPIGTPSAVCAGAVFLAGRLGTGSIMLSADFVLDNLYKWNKATGAATLVGPFGVNITSGTEAQFDNRDGMLYLVTGNELRRLDSTGGGGVLLCSFGNTATGIAPVYVNNQPPPLPAFQFCRTGLNLPIVDFQTTIDSVIAYPILGDDCIVIDANVRIDTVVHTYDSDLSFYLKRNNIGAKIINRAGGSGDNFIGTILNDSALTPIESGSAPFTGSYRPSTPLSAFNSNPGINGRYWKLLITDTAAGDTGFLSKWCVVVIFTCPVGGIQTIELPNYYSLTQNYPNPFNPTTIIKFTLPESQNVKLVVFDVLGREVKTLVNEVRSSGIYEVNFTASELSSGIYFYRLVTDNFTDTKKMLLIK